MRTSGKSHHVGVVTNVAGRPAEISLSYDVSTTEKICLFIAITDQLMASSTPRYGTHAHKSRWKISPWLFCRYRLVDTKINSEGFLRLFTKFSTPENYPLHGIYACIYTRNEFTSSIPFTCLKHLLLHQLYSSGLS